MFGNVSALILFYIDGLLISPMSDEKFIELGGTVTDDGEPTPFEYACAQFRQVCEAMGACFDG